MAYAVILTFDRKLAQKIKKIERIFEEGKIGTTASQVNLDPHITMANFEKADEHILIETVSQLKAIRFPVTLIPFGSFLLRKIVLFLNVVPTLDLLNLHNEYFTLLSKKKMKSDRLYSPDFWMPHCSLSIEIEPEKYFQGIDIITEYHDVLKGQVHEIKLMKYFPTTEVLVKELK